MEDDALTCSAWAGYYAAAGNAAERDKWADAARQRAGRVILKTHGVAGSWVEVRVSGEFDLDLCDQLLEIVNLTRRGCERHEKKKALEAEKALAVVGESPAKNDPA